MTKMTSSTRRQWQASRIVLAVSSATAIFLACGSDSSNDTKDNPQPDAGRDGPIIREPSPFLTVSIGPASVPADGTSVATITVNIRNPENDKPWVGQQVSLSSSGKGDRFTFINATTNDDGVLTATMTSTMVENKTVTVTKGEYYNSATVDFTGCKGELLVPLPPIPAGAAPTGPVAADFNRDGKIDIAFIADATHLKIWLAKGDGTFEVTTDYAPGPSLFSVASGDLNGDGKPDIAVTTGQGAGDLLTILLGKGDGKFERLRDYAVGTSVRLLKTADYNNDGKQDLVTVSTTDSAVGVLRGNGDGTFQSAVNTTVQKPSGVMFGDFNGDRNIDLAVLVPGENKLNTLLGNGDGTFRSAFAYDAPGTYNGDVGDFNGDKKLDIALGNYNTNEVRILLGAGNGSFTGLINYATGAAPVAIAAEIDGDGKLDLIVSNSEEKYVSFLLGNGNGTFQSAKKYEGSDSPGGAITGDFNGDGKADIVFPTSSAMNLILRSGCTR